MNIETCVTQQFWNAFHGGIIVAAIIGMGMLMLVAYIRYVNKISVKWLMAGLILLAVATAASAAFKAATGMYLAYSCSGALK